MSNLKNEKDAFTWATDDRIEAILFDVDGTLVDSYPGIARAAEQTLAEILPERSLRVPRAMIGPHIRTIFRNLLADIDEGFLNKLEKHFRQIYDNQTCTDCRAYQGVQDTLQVLNEKKLPCFVLTNKPFVPNQRILDHLQLTPYFSGVVSPDSVEPHFTSKAEAARYAIEQYGLNPERTLLIGDSKSDGEAARECGLKFLAVNYGYGDVHKKVEFSISSLTELLEIL